MRIINLDKGEAYQLSPDAQMEVERTNPFFNDWGEQSVPMSLPDTPHNRRILGHPDLLGNTKKMQRVNASIQDGEFYIACKQAVLSSKHNESIQTSFYMNEGAFYTNMKKISLKEVFADEFVPGVNSVNEAINWCRTLMKNEDPNYAIFPVLVDDDSGESSGYNYKIINAFGKMGEATVRYPAYFQLTNIDGSDFYNAVQRQEVVDNVKITLTAGYYISPFIRAVYVLRRVLSHFGYTLLDNFFTQTEPFSKMVFVNNVMDTIVNGRIRIAHLLPDVTCQDVLNLYRKKFHCEFIPDEINKTVTIKHFSEVLDGGIAADLTNCLTEEPNIEYKSENDYKRLTITPSDSLSDTEVEDSFESLADLVQSYPTAYFDPSDGCFYRIGFCGMAKITEKIATSSMKFDFGGDTEATNVEVPECMPELRELRYMNDAGGFMREGRVIYVGEYQSLNSKMVVAGEDTEEDSVSASKSKMPIMLAAPFVSQWTLIHYDRSGNPTVTNHKWMTATLGNIDSRNSSRKLWDYTLHYYGADGIFEKFYRRYDTLLRNSLHPLKAKLLLSTPLKRSLPSWQKVMLCNTPLLLNKFKYTLGGNNEPTESELLTIRYYEPIDEAPLFSDIIKSDTGYHWEAHGDRAQEVTEEEYENSGADKDRTLATIYPPIASAAYADGQPYFKQTCYRKVEVTGDPRKNVAYTKTTTWLTCEKDT